MRKIKAAVNVNASTRRDAGLGVAHVVKSRHRGRAPVKSPPPPTNPKVQWRREPLEYNVWDAIHREIYYNSVVAMKFCSRLFNAGRHGAGVNDDD